MFLKDRIAKVKEVKKLDNKELARLCGVHHRSVENYINGDNSPGEKFFVGLKSAFPEVNMNWLIAGEGDMYTNDVFIENNIVGEPHNNYKNESMSDEVAFLREQLRQKDKMLNWMQSQIDRLSTGKQVGMSETGT